MSALDPVKDVTGVLPVKVEEKINATLASKVDESKELLKETLKSATAKLVEANAKVSQLKTELDSKTVKSITELLNAILLGQAKALEDLETRITTIRDTSLGNPITPSLDLFTASYGSLVKEIPLLIETLKKIEAENGKLDDRIKLLEWGAKVESFVIALETLKGKFSTEGSLETLKSDLAILKSTLEALKKDMALNESLSAKLIPLWNNSVFELHRLEKQLSLKSGEFLLANLSSHLGEFVKLKETTSQKLLTLTPENFDPKAVASYFSMEEIKALLQLKTDYREAFKTYVAAIDFTTEVYYFPGNLKSLYVGDTSLEAHKSMLISVSRELTELKAKLAAEWEKTKVAATDAGSTLDRLYEAANNKGTALSSAAWLAYGSNIFKSAFQSPDKYLSIAETTVATLVKAVTPIVEVPAEPVII